MSKRKSDAAHGRDRDECFQEENSMSSPIAPTSIVPTSNPSTTVAAGAAGAAPTANAAWRTGAAESAVAVDAFPSSPPQEVLDQMASAAAVYDRFASQGRELRFARDQESGRMAVEVRDRAGNVLKQLSAAQALEVAAGAPLE